MRVLAIHNSYKFLGGEDTVFDQEVNAYLKLGYDVKTYYVSNKNLHGFDFIFCLWNPKSYFKVKRLIKNFRPDIVHIHNIIFKVLGVLGNVWQRGHVQRIDWQHSF